MYPITNFFFLTSSIGNVSSCKWAINTPITVVFWGNTFMREKRDTHTSCSWKIHCTPEMYPGVSDTTSDAWETTKAEFIFISSPSLVFAFSWVLLRWLPIAFRDLLLRSLLLHSRTTSKRLVNGWGEKLRCSIVDYFSQSQTKL